MARKMTPTLTDFLWKTSENANDLVREAVQMYKTGAYPRACFLALTAQEEMSKVVSAVMKASAGTEWDPSKDKDFRNHYWKLTAATQWALFVNSGASRRLRELEQVHAELFRKGDLGKIRNACLYVDVEGDDVVDPKSSIDRKLALAEVRVAFEVAAELSDFGNGLGLWGQDDQSGLQERWLAILREAESFAKEFGVE